MLPLAVLAALTQSACRGPSQPAAAPAIVLASPVLSRRGTGSNPGDTVSYPIEAAPRYSNAMSFRVGGKLIERGARLGDAVHKGQVLARLDAVDAQKQAASAQAALEAAEHRLAFAKQQLDRDQAQSAQNLIAANQLEQTQDSYAAALAGRDESAAQLAVARNTLQYNALVADHDGVITSENADTGQVLAAGQAVYGLAWTGDTDVILDAAAGDLPRIAVGQTASVKFAALPGQFEARVREVAPAADPQSRTYRVKLTLIQPAGAVRFGMTGEALLSTSTSGAAAPVFNIPATAIFHRGNDPAVWLIRATDSTLELRPVTVQSYGERSVIVAGGLREGDSIVLAGVHTVFAGELVKPVKPLFAGEAEGDDGRR
ncbi:MAG TPA: efflux RND transporter periplasmic adaptor subunit [Steroidobacteraceae bacterium]|nr:efflux RND transporter periplasmic adaptor subunit [Steroidobacteraceae bacterium]